MAGIQNWIINASARHAGLFTFFVDELVDRFKTADAHVPPNVMLRFLMSTELVDVLARVRIFPVDYRPDSPDNAELLLNLLLKGPQPFVSTTKESDQQAQVLLRRGCIVREGDRVALSSPAVKSILLSRWLRPPAPRDAYLDGFHDFIHRAIQKLNPRRLDTSLSTSANEGRLLESMWQHEFYLAACTVLPAEFSLSSDVGREFDSDGRVNFYINSKLGWAIEITREGLLLEESRARFMEGGIYYEMVQAGDIKEWIVLDFCAKRPSKQLPHVLYAVYSNDYRSIKLYGESVSVPVELALVDNAMCRGLSSV